jgi:membrane protease YdiL (CAAX protease family)
MDAMAKPQRRYPPELKERAYRLVADWRRARHTGDAPGRTTGDEHRTGELETKTGSPVSLNGLMTVGDKSGQVDECDREGFAGVRTAVVFYLLAFATSWMVWGSAIVWSGLEDWEPLIIIVGAYGPLVAAVVVTKMTAGTGVWLRRVARLRRRGRWTLVGGLGLPLLIAVAHVLVYRMFVGSVALSSDPPWYWAASAAPVNIGLLFWLGSAVEEFGWQGVAVPALTERFAPLVAAGVHGIVWGTWHLPLYLVDAWSGDEQTILVLYGITITLSPIMTWLTRSAAGAVMPAVVFHAGTNHYTTLVGDDTTLFDPPLVESFDEVKLAIYLIVALIICAATRGRLDSGRPRGGTPMRSRPDDIAADRVGSPSNE